LPFAAENSAIGFDVSGAEPTVAAVVIDRTPAARKTSRSTRPRGIARRRKPAGSRKKAARTQEENRTRDKFIARERTNAMNPRLLRRVPAGVKERPLRDTESLKEDSRQ
jgi:hypothetical protein